MAVTWKRLAFADEIILNPAGDTAGAIQFLNSSKDDLDADDDLLFDQSGAVKKLQLTDGDVGVLSSTGQATLRSIAGSPGEVMLYLQVSSDHVALYPDKTSTFSKSLQLLGSLLIRRTAQSAEPTLDNSEIRIWRDSDDGKVYLVYNDAESGQKKIELT